MEIRKFKNGDEVALFHVFLSSVRTIASRDYTPEQVEAWVSADRDQEQWVNSMRALRPFVVELEGEIVGYADVQSNGYIDNFFVSGTYPKQGVGSLLMNRIHEEAKILGISELTSNVSKTAEPFFLKHGFHVVERAFPTRRGVTLQNALMRKTLEKA